MITLRINAVAFYADDIPVSGAVRGLKDHGISAQPQAMDVKLSKNYSHL
jgi:hypothetical protein